MNFCSWVNGFKEYFVKGMVYDPLVYLCYLNDIKSGVLPKHSSVQLSEEDLSLQRTFIKKLIYDDGWDSVKVKNEVYTYMNSAGKRTNLTNNKKGSPRLKLERSMQNEIINLCSSDVEENDVSFQKKIACESYSISSTSEGDDNDSISSSSISAKFTELMNNSKKRKFTEILVSDIDQTPKKIFLEMSPVKRFCNNVVKSENSSNQVPVSLNERKEYEHNDIKSLQNKSILLGTRLHPDKMSEEGTVDGPNDTLFKNRKLDLPATTDLISVNFSEAYHEMNSSLTSFDQKDNVCMNANHSDTSISHEISFSDNNTSFTKIKSSEKIAPPNNCGRLYNKLISRKTIAASKNLKKTSQKWVKSSDYGQNSSECYNLQDDNRSTNNYNVTSTNSDSILLQSKVYNGPDAFEIEYLAYKCINTQEQLKIYVSYNPDSVEKLQQKEAMELANNYLHWRAMHRHPPMFLNEGLDRVVEWTENTWKKRAEHFFEYYVYIPIDTKTNQIYLNLCSINDKLCFNGWKACSERSSEKEKSPTKRDRLQIGFYDEMIEIGGVDVEGLSIEKIKTIASSKMNGKSQLKIRFRKLHPFFNKNCYDIFINKKQFLCGGKSSINVIQNNDGSFALKLGEGVRGRNFLKSKNDQVIAINGEDIRGKSIVEVRGKEGKINLSRSETHVHVRLEHFMARIHHKHTEVSTENASVASKAPIENALEILDENLQKIGCNSTERIKKNIKVNDLFLMEFVESSFHSTIDRDTMLPKKRIAVVEPTEEVMYSFEVNVRKSGIPNAGYGAFLTYVGAHRLNGAGRNKVASLIEKGAYQYPKTKYELTAVLPVKRKKVSVKLKGKHLHGDEETRGKHLGLLGMLTKSDYEETDYDFCSYYEGCGLIDLGRYAPVLKEDIKTTLQFNLKEFIFSNVPNEWVSSVKFCIFIFLMEVNSPFV